MINIVKIIFMATSLTMIAAPTYAKNNLKHAASDVNFTYADFADLVTEAPMVVDLQIRKIRKLPKTQSMGVAENIQRVLAEADVNSLLRGPSGIAAKQKFLIDLQKNAQGKMPKLKKMRFFAFASPVNGRNDMLQLIRPDALVKYSESSNIMVRRILPEAVRIDAPQKITGVSSAFHSPGNILSEGETQIFLTTENRQPFGLSIINRNDTGREWSVSTSEVISDSVPAPKRNTLLWYRLACGLPKTLPQSTLNGANAENTAKAEADFQYIRGQLGQCDRTRPSAGN